MGKAAHTPLARWPDPRPEIDQQIDGHRAKGTAFRLAVSPNAIADLRANTAPENWTENGDTMFYRGEQVHIHDEWSWGWCLIPTRTATAKDDR